MFVGLIVKKGSTWKAKHPRKEDDKSWNRSTCFANSTSTSRLNSAMCPEGVVTLPCLALSGGTCRKSECNCYVPASIAARIPQRQNLSGVLLKPLRTWDYPSSLPFVPNCPYSVYSFVLIRRNDRILFLPYDFRWNAI